MIVITYDTTNKTVTLDIEEYINLVADRYMLDALEAGGVDNWDYYDDSRNESVVNFRKFKRELSATTGLTLDEIDDMLD